MNPPALGAHDEAAAPRRHELGKTIVVVLHDLNFAAAYADRIIALRDGEVLHAGTVEDIMRDEVLTEVFDTPVRVYDIEGRRTAVYTM